MTDFPKDSLTDQTVGSIKDWALSTLGVVGCISIAAGLYDHLPELPLFTILLAMAITIASVWKIQEQIKGEEQATLPSRLEGPLLWTALAWMLFRVTGTQFPQAIILPAALIGWLAATCPPNIFLVTAGAALIMECGLTLTGNQDIQNMIINVACYALPAAGILFTSGKKLTIGIRPRKKTKPKKVEKKITEEEIKELGLFSTEAPLLESLPPLSSLEGTSPYSQATVDSITASFDLQLELIRRALNLTTVAVLWQDSGGRQLRLRNLASSRSDIHKGPYQTGSGITGALASQKDEISMAPVPANYAGIPYYINSGGVGSIMLMRIPENEQLNADDQDAAKKSPGVLCVDREDTAPWTEQERKILRITARKLALDVNAGRSLLNMDRERSSIQRLCLGLRELNSSLGLESVFGSTIKAVKALVPADFIAISLLDGDRHRTVFADGPKAEELKNQEYEKSEGLVGQVLRTNSVLPAGCRYHGAAPIFDKGKKFEDFNSLIILPLRKDKGTAFGALTVASKKDNIFTVARREILGLVAEQVAIKIDLGQAHEKINQMAITDGLTGLANHRTFQHAFDIMRARAQRNATPLCLIMCDLDHFKNINDTYGHPFGDKVLVTVANILKKAVRSIDLVARYGGEEFAIILEDSDHTGGPTMAERIRNEIETLTMNHADEKVKITISLGLAVYPKDGEAKGEIIEKADQALYHAKRTGRNKSVSWSSNMKEEADS